MNCRDCLHFKACYEMATANGAEEFNTLFANKCEDFTNHSEWVHLPCNIGKEFFRTIPWRNIVDECAVSSLTKKSDKTWKIRLTSSVFRTTFEITINDIGKTVFLTREEAEKALERIKYE